MNGHDLNQVFIALKALDGLVGVQRFIGCVVVGQPINQLLLGGKRVLTSSQAFGEVS